MTNASKKQTIFQVEGIDIAEATRKINNPFFHSTEENKIHKTKNASLFLS